MTNGIEIENKLKCHSSLFYLKIILGLKILSTQKTLIIHHSPNRLIPYSINPSPSTHISLQYTINPIKFDIINYGIPPMYLLHHTNLYSSPLIIPSFINNDIFIFILSILLLLIIVIDIIFFLNINTKIQLLYTHIYIFIILPQYKLTLLLQSYLLIFIPPFTI